MNPTLLLSAVDIEIPGYQIVKPIGEGGMASVFLAVQKSLEREVALKVMSPVLAANAEFASRFLIEGKITAQLQHPNLVTIYDIGCHNGLYYLAAEYIPAGTLKERLAARSLTVAEILDITGDIAQGLDFAHRKGFVHRDVKPGNILFRNDGHAVLADFGIAKAMDGSNSSTVAGVSIGTPDYMSPEQARGEQVDGRSDLYSLGTLLFEMLVGNPPYSGSDPFAVALMHVTHPVPQLPEPYQWLQPLIAGLMAKQVSERFNTGAATVQAIHQLLASAPEGMLLQESSRRRPALGARLSADVVTERRTKVRLLNNDLLRRWLVPVALTALVALGLLSWVLWPKAGPSADSGSDSSAIERDLNQATAYLEMGTAPDGGGRKLIFPDDDSALTLYRRVLAADPKNARATQGIGDLLSYYRRYAQVACGSRQWSNCSAIAGMGLRVDPADEQLIRIKAAAEAGQRGDQPN